jgi:hypothetical protein
MVSSRTNATSAGKAGGLDETATQDWRDGDRLIWFYRYGRFIPGHHGMVLLTEAADLMLAPG